MFCVRVMMKKQIVVHSKLSNECLWPDSSKYFKIEKLNQKQLILKNVLQTQQGIITF